MVKRLSNLFDRVRASDSVVTSEEKDALAGTSSRVDAPPPYSTSAANTGDVADILDKKRDELLSTGLPNIARPLNAKEQLQRYLIEIVAFTFNVNLDELNSALLGSENIAKGTMSILSDEERADLLRISKKITDLLHRSNNNEMLTTFAKDRKELYDAILEPARNISYFIDKFCLDIIASYADHECDFQKWDYTTLGYWAKNPEGWSFDKERDLRRALQSHSCLIRKIAPSEKVQHILGQGLEDFQRRKGLRGIKQGYICCPVRDGFAILTCVIRDFEAPY